MITKSGARTKKFSLKRESLTELSTTDLDKVVGGQPVASPGPILVLRLPVIRPRLFQAMKHRILAALLATVGLSFAGAISVPASASSATAQQVCTYRFLQTCGPPTFPFSLPRIQGV
jgi:hypothetical protein